MLAITVRKPLFRAMTSGIFSGVEIINGRAIATMVKIVEPAETIINVLMPASLPANSLSRPMNSPMARATTSLTTICSSDSIAI